MSSRLALVGAETPAGALAAELFTERQLPLSELIVLAVDPYDLDSVTYGKQKIRPTAIDGFDFAGADIVLFADDKGLAATHGPKAADAGCFVIYMGNDDALPDAGVPVVPEVNPSALQSLARGAIISSPDPASIFLALLLKPLAGEFPLRDVTVCSHRPAVVAGKPGIEELVGQTARLLNGMATENQVFTQQAAFNVLAATAPEDDDGFSRHEQRLVTETQQLLEDPAILIHPTCVQVPVFYAQSLAVSVVAETPMPVERVTALLRDCPGIQVIDGRGPTAVTDATGSDDLYVGRIRQSGQDNQQISLWCVGDELRKGATLNAVQIAEILIKSHL